MRWMLLFLVFFLATAMSAQDDRVDSLRRKLDRTTASAERAELLNQLARSLAPTDPERAIEYGQQAFALATQQQLPQAVADARRWMAAAAYYGNRPEDALRWGRDFASRARQVGDADGQIFALKLLAYVSESLNRPDSSLHYFEAYAALAQRLDRPADAASALNSIGVVNFDLGRIRNAINYYEQALQRYRELADTASMALSYNNIGAAYRDLGQPDVAMRYLFDGLAIAEADRDNYYISLACYNIGLVHWDQKNYDTALDYLRRSLALDDPRLANRRVKDLGTMGALFLDLGQQDSAAYYYGLARDEARRVDDQVNLAGLLGQMAALELEAGRWEAAEPLLTEALAISERLGLQKEYITARYGLGRLYEAAGRPDRVIETLRPALALADSTGYTEDKITALDRLSRAYAATGDYAKAYATARAYADLQATLSDSTKQQQIAELETRYQTARKDQQLAARELQLTRERTTRYWLYLSLALVLAGAIGIWAWYRARIRRRRREAEQLRELDRIKSNFFANISHEFRTPLTLLLGPVERALEAAPASDREAEDEAGAIPYPHLGMMRRNALRLQQLIDQLLDLSKLESGRLRLRVAPGDLVAFLRALVFSFESLAQRQDIRLETEFPAALPGARFDRDQLEKIVVNLLSNAFKFTPGGGTVRVAVTENKGRISLEVRDTGPGIPQSELVAIFDRFYQSETTEAKGTGIGLALVRELVQLHGGTIDVESEPGRGTRFRVGLPYRLDTLPEEVEQISGADAVRTVPPPPVERREADRLAASGPTSKDLRPRVLIVEDNADLRQYIGDHLREDYALEFATDGQEGTDIALATIPDLVISDVMMPQRDGFELCALLKTDPRTSHIPVILLTAKAGRESKLTGLEQGADAYLTKPFDARELRIRVAQLIEQRRQLRERFGGEFRLRPSAVQVSSVDEQFLQTVRETIEANLGNELFSVEDLAAAVNFSRSQLHRKVKALTDKSPNQLIREFRMLRAKELLEQQAATVAEIAFRVGYSNPSYFSRSYKEAFGELPSETLEAAS